MSGAVRLPITPMSGVGDLIFPVIWRRAFLAIVIPGRIKFLVAVDRQKSDRIQTASVEPALACTNDPTAVFEFLQRALHGALRYPTVGPQEFPCSLQVAVVVALELRTEFEEHLAGFA